MWLLRELPHAAPRLNRVCGTTLVQMHCLRKHLGYQPVCVSWQLVSTELITTIVRR
jgi:hypothetical protein